MELYSLCIQKDCQKLWCSESNMHNHNATLTQILETIFTIEWRQSLHPATVTNESCEYMKFPKPMKVENIKITVWSINTISFACLPLCLLTCHISVIQTAIFQVPFLVCNSEMKFSFRDITTNKWQYFFL